MELIKVKRNMYVAVGEVSSAVKELTELFDNALVSLTLTEPEVAYARSVWDHELTLVIGNESFARLRLDIQRSLENRHKIILINTEV